MIALLLFYMCAHNHLSFLASIFSVVMTNISSKIIESLLLLRTTIHMSIQGHLQVVLPPFESHGETNSRPIQDFFIPPLLVPPFEAPYRIDSRTPNSAFHSRVSTYFDFVAQIGSPRSSQRRCATCPFHTKTLNNCHRSKIVLWT